MIRRVLDWLDDGGSRWIFWTLISLAVAVLELTWGDWWFAGLYLALALAWGVRIGPRLVTTKRRARSVHALAEEARARFYWTMGAQGVPLEQTRRADQLLAEGSTWQANAIIREHVEG